VCIHLFLADPVYIYGYYQVESHHSLGHPVTTSVLRETTKEHPVHTYVCVCVCVCVCVATNQIVGSDYCLFYV